MKRHFLAATVIAVAGSSAAAQDIEWVATPFDNTLASQPGTANDPFKDITAFTSATTLFRIGNNPISVAYDGANLYIGGNVNGPTTIEDPNNPGTFIDLSNEIAEISDFFGAAAAKEVLGTEVLSSEFGAFSGRGYTGLDWDDTYGLLMTRDFGSDAAVLPQVLLANRLLPTDFNASVVLTATGIRGGSGPAFDNGFDGNGFALADGSTGPAAAVPFWTSGAAYGLDPTSFDPADDIYGPDFGSPSDPMAPLYIFFPPDGATGSLWRDFDIHPTTGLIAARGNNAVSLTDRTSLNGGENIRSIILPGGQGLAVNQNIEIIHNPACGDDFIVVNDRPTSTTFFPFQQAVRFYDLAGNALTYSIEFPDGTLIPLDQGNPANIFSFFWHEPDQILFIVDGQNRDVYALTLKCAIPPACIGDLDGDGDTDVFDFGIFGPAFGTSLGDPGYLPEADFDNNDTIDVFDFGIFGPDFGCTP